MISPDKTQFVLFGVRQLLSKFPSNITVPFLGQDLVPVAAARDRGVTFDLNLTFNGHTASLTSPILSTSVQINRVPHLFSKDVLYIILNSLQLAILLVRNSHAGTQRSHWGRTNKGNYHLKLCLPFVPLAPVRLLRPSMAVLYHVNGELQRAYLYWPLVAVLKACVKRAICLKSLPLVLLNENRS